MKAQRPVRRKERDFAGREFSLPEGASAWRLLHAGGADANLLILGLGPDGTPPFAAQPDQKIFWIEAPQTLRESRVVAPLDWRKAEPENLAELAKTCSVYFYGPALRLAPQFWLPLLARIDLVCNPPFSKAAAPLIWLPGTDQILLHQELKQALRQLGWTNIVERQPNAGARSAREAFGGAKPDLAICVNLRGLDREGRLFALLRELRIPLAIWMVDNPWNLLSALLLPWWRDAHIFVTDASFIAPLQAYGARHVAFLPLAGSLHMRNGVQCAARTGRGAPLFVGRSAFPDKAAFFAGIKLKHALWQEALNLLSQGTELPDFHWWASKCGQKLWPGKGGREPALGAEDCSRMRRALWLGAALDHELRIVGDAGWREIFPAATVLPPVDYYGSLPELYARAECCLNVTSLLLPQSLSQRHFDVWLAGGLLVSDPTPGLGIFPPELVQPMRLTSPGDFGRKLAEIRQNPGAANALRVAWQEEILARHLYQHRIASIMATLVGTAALRKLPGAPECC